MEIMVGQRDPDEKLPRYETRPDGRVETKRVVLRWPADWWERMEQRLEFGEISNYIRTQLLREIDNDPQAPLSPPPAPGRPSQTASGNAVRLKTKKTPKTKREKGDNKTIAELIRYAVQTDLDDDPENPLSRPLMQSGRQWLYIGLNSLGIPGRVTDYTRHERTLAIKYFAGKDREQLYKNTIRIEAILQENRPEDTPEERENLEQILGLIEEALELKKKAIA